MNSPHGTLWRRARHAACGRLGRWLLLAAVAADLVAAPVQITITVDSVPEVTTTWPPDMARLAVYHEFLRRNPDINVAATTILKIEGDASEGNEYLAIAGGIAPDVFYLHGRKIGAFRQQNFIQPLTPFIQRDFEQTGKPFRGIGVVVSAAALRDFRAGSESRAGDLG
ncbi:MAG: hypothetical protein NTV22_08345 [bacterium]|nr:hypothetical protein [bacterium]